jgi:hypothetical protein
MTGVESLPHTATATVYSSLTPSDAMEARGEGRGCCSSLLRLRSDILISNEVSHTTRSPPQVAALVAPPPLRLP